MQNKRTKKPYEPTKYKQGSKANAHYSVFSIHFRSFVDCYNVIDIAQYKINSFVLCT